MRGDFIPCRSSSPRCSITDDKFLAFRDATLVDKLLRLGHDRELFVFCTLEAFDLRLAVGPKLHDEVRVSMMKVSCRERTNLYISLAACLVQQRRSLLSPSTS